MRTYIIYERYVCMYGWHVQIIHEHDIWKMRGNNGSTYVRTYAHTQLMLSGSRPEWPEAADPSVEDQCSYVAMKFVTFDLCLCRSMPDRPLRSPVWPRWADQVYKPYFYTDCALWFYINLYLSCRNFVLCIIIYNTHCAGSPNNTEWPCHSMYLYTDT